MPSLRYFVHLDAPGWHVIGGGEPPFVGVDLGNNENMAWGVTFAGIDEVDTYVEQTNPANPNETKFNDTWVPMKIIREEIKVKGEDKPRVGGAEVLEARSGVLRGPGAAPRVRRQVLGPGAGHRAVQGQLQACASDQLRGLLRSRHVLEAAVAQFDLRRQEGEHRAAGLRLGARPRRMDRAAACPRDGEV